MEEHAAKSQSVTRGSTSGRSVPQVKREVDIILSFTIDYVCVRENLL